MSEGAESPTAFSRHAHAKVNLTLEVLGRLPDGYHEVATVMQALALHDVLSFAPSDDLVVLTDTPELMLPDNLVLRAAQALQMETATRKGARIVLEKNIPLAAGLGGGSTDAACTLSALNELWELNLPAARLMGIGARLGADVPFFFVDGTALATGKGETITPLPPFPSRQVLLVCPRVRLPDKTRAMYSRIKPSHYSNGAATRRLVEALKKGEVPDIEADANVFLPILLAANAVVRDCYDRMRQLSIYPVLLSGAGPTLFTLIDDDARAQRLQGHLRDLDADIILTRTAPNDEAGPRALTT